jgi:hypothetical protein
MAYDENWNWIPDEGYASGYNFDLQSLLNAQDGYEPTNYYSLPDINQDQLLQTLLDNISDYAYGPNSDQNAADYQSGSGSNILSSILSGLGSTGSSLLSALSGATQSGSGVGSSSLLSNLLTGAGGLYSAYSQGQLADKQMELAKYVLEKGDPYKDYRTGTEIPMMQGVAGRLPGQLDQTQQFGQQASQKLNDPMLSNLFNKSYTDPLSVYNSPEMQAVNQQFMNGIERRDAAAGRNSQYGARAVEAQNNFLTQSLPQYRQGLVGGMQANTQTGSALSGLFGQQAGYAQNLGNLAKPGGQAGSGVQQFGNIASGANAAGAFSMNPVFGSLASIFGQNGG